MAIFDFPNHTFSTENPDSTFRAKLGGSYQYAAAPSAPDQRIFKLRFAVMKYFVVAGAIDKNVQPAINLARLEAFYAAQKLHGTFTYPHPVYGDLMVSFNKPLNIPEGLINGNGAVANIEVEFVEKPGISDSGLGDMTEIEYVDFP